MLITYLTVITLGIFSQELPDTLQATSFYIIQEEFSDLEDWENFSFSGDKNPTQYRIETDSSLSYLKMISQSSASGLIYKNQYDPNQHPIMSWRWQVENVINQADGKTKSGDDYPIRIFVMFDDDSAETSFWTSIRNSAIKLLYGTEPPESSFCFVWSNMKYDEKYFDSPYSETVKIIPMEKGENRLKDWFTHDVNIVELYKEIYNRSCPTEARIALMSDTDNTESETRACLDFIRVSID
jgi:hypothetical protein